MVAWGNNYTSPTATLSWGNETSATTTSATVYIVRNDTNYSTTPTIEETRQQARSRVVYTNYAPAPRLEALPASHWYDPPIVAPSGRGPVGAYEATVRPRPVVWRCAPRASARRARFNWRKRPHGSKRRKLR
jgi:hypothetical protein